MVRLLPWLALFCWQCNTGLPADDRFEAICRQYRNTFDYAIVGGTLIDGSGGPARQADLLIRDDSIVYIGPVDTSRLKVTVLQANGQVVTPGFVDAHAHGDPLEDDFDNFLSMGVTTVLLGQDGFSPVNSPAFTTPWEFFDSLGEKEHLINLSFLAGHGSLRQQAGLAARRELDSLETGTLVRLLDESLAAGCFGMSTGLEYLPGSLAQEGELLALARKTGESQTLLMSHLRNEDDQEMNASIGELLEQGRYCDVHISHLKVVFGKDRARALEILTMLDSARSQGIHVSADVYPYTASYTGIGIVFPPWAKTRTDFEKARISRSSELRDYLHRKIMARNGPEATLFATRPFTGQTLAEVARESGQDFVDVLMKLGPQGASGAYFVMNEDIQEVFIVHPDIMIASDGGPALRHPRSSGTFAKIIEEYVAGRKLISLETAIHKMSGLPAGTLKLPQRGELREGFKADILIFDPMEVRNRSSYEDPFRKAIGFQTVMINGRLVRYLGETVCGSFGRVIRRK
jgi:N-acyl-D-amino-acid deacylase